MKKVLALAMVGIVALLFIYFPTTTSVLLQILLSLAVAAAVFALLFFGLLVGQKRLHNFVLTEARLKANQLRRGGVKVTVNQAAVQRFVTYLLVSGLTGTLATIVGYAVIRHARLSGEYEIPAIMIALTASAACAATLCLAAKIMLTSRNLDRKV